MNGGPHSPVTQMVEGDDLMLKSPQNVGSNDCKTVAEILPDITLKTPLQGTHKFALSVYTR